jgi:ABC-type Fe3+/spermidine/putrescine transport system ATPase subunit
VAGFIGRSTQLDGVVQPGGMVRAKGQALRADAASQLAPGTEVKIFIRPEDVLLSPAMTPPPDGIQVQLASLEYLGPVCRLGLQAGEAMIEADIRSDRLNELQIDFGRPMSMLIPSDRALVFPGYV